MMIEEDGVTAYTRALGDLGGLCKFVGDGAMLDFGCGEGEWVDMMAKKYPQTTIYGMTLPEHSHLLKKNKGKLIGNILEGGIELSDGELKAIISVYGLIYMTHLDEIATAVEELDRVLTSDGVLRFNMNTVSGIPLKSVGEFGGKINTFVAARDWTNLLIDHGYGVVTLRSHRLDKLDTIETVVVAQKGVSDKWLSWKLIGGLI